MDRVFRSWAGLASHFIGECFDCAAPFIDEAYAGLDPLVRFVSAQLFIDCHLSSESVLLLVHAQKEWDADLVSRSIMEGSLKFTFMLGGTPEEVKAKVEEFWHLLPQFSAVKRSERARHFLEEIDDPHNPQWKPIHELIMDTEDIKCFREKYPRKQRQMLEEKWSFSGICKAFAQSGDEGLRKFVHLAHGYGMSSHLLHKDADGVAMVWERYRRQPDRQAAVKLAHASRVVSDVCSFASLRLSSLLRACGRRTDEVTRIRDRYAEPLFAELAKAGRRFTTVEYGHDVPQ